MTKMTFKQVGKNISEVIQECNLTQQKLADDLNISKQVMSKIIAGGKAINVLEIKLIAEKLNVSIERLLHVNEHEEDFHSFSFMGSIKSNDVKRKINMLSDVIDEILMLEEYSDEE